MLSAHEPELDQPSRRAGQERMCALTREVRPTGELIRFVVGPEGIVPDLSHKLPGRGLWITATARALNEAIARKLFARGFKQDVRVAPDLVATTERLLLRDALNALAIARKAGLVVAGFMKVLNALAREEVIALLHAKEAAADGIRKLDNALRAARGAELPAVIGDFSSAQLDLALGRLNVVHAALLAGPAGEAFLSRVKRLDRFRTGHPGDKS